MGWLHQLNTRTNVYGENIKTIGGQIKEAFIILMGEENLGDGYEEIYSGDKDLWNYIAWRKLFFIIGWPFKLLEFVLRVIYILADSLPQLGVTGNHSHENEEITEGYPLFWLNTSSTGFSYLVRGGRFFGRSFFALILGTSIFLVSCFSRPINHVYRPIVQWIQRNNLSESYYKKCLAILAPLLMIGTSAFLILNAFFIQSLSATTFLWFARGLSFITILTGGLGAFSYYKHREKEIQVKTKTPSGSEKVTPFRLLVVLIFAAVFGLFMPTLLSFATSGMAFLATVTAQAFHFMFASQLTMATATLVVKPIVGVATFIMSAVLWHRLFTDVIPNLMNFYRSFDPSLVYVEGNREDTLHSRLYFHTPVTTPEIPLEKQDNRYTFTSFCGGNSFLDKDKYVNTVDELPSGQKSPIVF